MKNSHTKYDLPEMLSCPFCGGEPSVRTHGGWEEFDTDTEYPFGTFFSVGCSQPISGREPHCQIQPRTCGVISPQLAADIWNIRQQ